MRKKDSFQERQEGKKQREKEKRKEGTKKEGRVFKRRNRGKVRSTDLGKRKGSE